MDIYYNSHYPMPFMNCSVTNGCKVNSKLVNYDVIKIDGGTLYKAAKLSDGFHESKCINLKQFARRQIPLMYLFKFLSLCHLFYFAFCLFFGGMIAIFMNLQ